MNERRYVERFNLVSQAKIRVEKLPCGAETDALATRDISCDGGFFITRRPLPVGTEVCVTLTLDTNEANKTSEIRAVCITLQGRVCRQESCGMAIRFEPHDQWEKECIG